MAIICPILSPGTLSVTWGRERKIAKKGGNRMVDSAGDENPGDAEESLETGGSGGGGVAATPAGNARYIWSRQ